MTRAEWQMRLWMIPVLAVLLCGLGRPVMANCLIIDQLDKLHTLQARMARNPDTGLFSSDIRQLRAISSRLSDRDVLSAVDGNALMGRGAGFVRFMAQTQSLLRGASVDDPLSVQAHFGGPQRALLQDIAGYLTDLRCTREQITIAQAAAAAEEVRQPNEADTDNQDLQDISDALARAAAEVFQLRTLVLLILIGTAAMIMTPFINRWLILRRRRAKRHNTSFATRYRNGDTTTDGVLLDINCYGTKLRHQANAPHVLGLKIGILIEGYWADGTVVWSNVHYSGVQFNRAITLDQVQQVIQIET